MTAADWQHRGPRVASHADIDRRWWRDGFTYFLDVDNLSAEWSPLVTSKETIGAPVFLVLKEVVDGRVRTRRLASDVSVGCKRCATAEAIGLYMKHVLEEDIRKEAEERVKREPASRSTREVDVVERARRYLERMDPSISGSFGRNAMFHACQVLMRGFALTMEQAYPLALEYDARSSPPWGPRGVREKLREAFQRGQMKMRSLVDQPLARRSRRGVG